MTDIVTPTPSLRDSWRRDLPASLVLVVIALPLCLGIALASGAPLSAGIVSGVLGGIAVGLLSNSQLMVTGPAAGLTVIVATGIGTLGSFNALLTAVLIAGLLQLVFSVLRVGVVGYYIPSSLTKGILASIGIVLILKQLPHAVGYDADFVGDEAFQQSNAQNTFSALFDTLQNVRPGAVIVALVSLALLVLLDRPALRRVRLLPAPLIVVAVGVIFNAIFVAFAPTLAIQAPQLVQLPGIDGARGLAGFFIRPDWLAFASIDAWRLGATIAVVASVETLISLEATDKIDQFKRYSDTNRELLAQGIGNTLAGLIGGLPMTGVIVRSAANIDAGARTRWSAVLHGVLLLVFVLAIPSVLNRIPLASIAALLIYTGYKLATPALFRTTWSLGKTQFLPFALTIIAVVMTNLLVGIAVGVAAALIIILGQSLGQPALKVVSPKGAVLTRFQLPDQATFLARANIERTLSALPDGCRVEIDGTKTTRFDYDVLERLHDFSATAQLRNIDYRLVGIPAAPTTPTHHA